MTMEHSYTIEHLQYPFQYPDLAAVGGRIKSRPTDFVVEEVPSIEPSGRGDYLWVYIEKRGLSMEQMLRHLNRHLDMGQSEIGYAGLKDKQALTRQWLSLPGRCEPVLHTASNDSIKVLRWVRHDQRLKIGQLVGNKFSVLLRNAPGDNLHIVQEALDRMSRDGFFNVFGAQRMGRDMVSVRVGRDVVTGECGMSAMSRLKRRFVVAAIQSYLFNLYVWIREKQGLARKLLPGDVVQDTRTQQLSVSKDPASDESRCERKELAVTGPIFGRMMMQAAGSAGAIESETLERLGMTLGSFDEFHQLGAGTRRPLLAFPSQHQCCKTSDGIRLQFFLTKGSYATVLLREIVKRDV